MSDQRDEKDAGVPTEKSPASQGTEGAEPPPEDFDPAEQPSNPDLVADAEPPDD